MYVHRKIEFVTVHQNSLNYGGGKIIFHRSVVKAGFVFRNGHETIDVTARSRSGLWLQTTEDRERTRRQSEIPQILF